VRKFERRFESEQVWDREEMNSVKEEEVRAG
jgi:hypothetical protein